MIVIELKEIDEKEKEKVGGKNIFLRLLKANRHGIAINLSESNQFYHIHIHLQILQNISWIIVLMWKKMIEVK